MQANWKMKLGKLESSRTVFGKNLSGENSDLLATLRKFNFNYSHSYKSRRVTI